MRRVTFAVCNLAVLLCLLQGCKKTDEHDGKVAASALPPANVERLRVPVGDSPIRGPRLARVTILEWGDFDCPNTAAAENTVGQIMNHYGNDVRVVWKNLPLPSHGAARPLAAIAMTAYAKKGSDAFWKFHDTLLRNYHAPDREERERREAESDRDDDEPEFEHAVVQKYGKEAGLDDDDIERALDLDNRRVDADAQQAHAIGVFGTPTFLINGRPFAGAQPFEAFKKLIDEEIALATKTMQTGVDLANVYDAVTRNGKQSSTIPAATSVRR